MKKTSLGTGVPGKKRREPLPGNNRCAKQSFAYCQEGEERSEVGPRFSPLTTPHRGCSAGTAALWILSLIFFHLAADASTAATIKIVNQLQASVERTGASFGCGPYNKGLSSVRSQEQIQCESQGVVYYDISLPAANLAPQAATQSVVIAYPTESMGYGRLGFQYAVAGKPRIGCSLIMDFSGAAVTELQIQPLYSNPWVSCVNVGTNSDVQLVIKSNGNEKE